MQNKWIQKHLGLLLLLFSLVIFLNHAMYFEHLFRHYREDDAYISMRYAQNFAEGNGLVYNVGERVEGYTNFLWVILLAVGAKMGLDLPIVSGGISIFFGACVLVATYLLTSLFFPKEEEQIYRAIPSLLLACSMGNMYFSVWGLESQLFVFCIVLGTYFFFKESFYISSFCYVLSALARPEGLGVFGLVLLSKLIFGPRKPKEFLQFVLPFCVIFIPYFIWRYEYYGYLLPNTFYAKVGTTAHSFLPQIFRGWVYIKDSLVFLCIILPIFLIPFAFVKNKEYRPKFYTLLFVTLGFLGYTILVGGDTFMPRFVFHVFPFLLIMILLGLVQIFRSTPWKQAGVMGLAGVLCLVFLLQTVLEGKSYIRPREHFYSGWVTLGKWLKANAPPDSVLAVDAAGAIPYFSRLKTIDMLGLNNIHIAHREMPKMGKGFPGHEKTDPAYVLSRKPDFICCWIFKSGTLFWNLDSVPEMQTDYKALVLMNVLYSDESFDRLKIVDNQTFKHTTITELYNRGYTYLLFVRKETLPKLHLSPSRTSKSKTE